MSPSVWWDNGTVVEDMRKLQKLLAIRYNGLKYVEARGAGHNEHAWAERVGPMLKYLFP
jgi:hypothetical protein